MKKAILKTMTILVLGIFLTTSVTSCYGKFELTHKLYSWNGALGDKYINSIVMWVLMIIPVYSIAGGVDFVILNTIEFWTGQNPLAMQPGDIEQQTVVRNGEAYTITATQNRFDIIKASGNEKMSLVYHSQEKSWYVQSGDQNVKVASEKGNNQVELVRPDGSTFVFNTTTGQLAN